MIFSQEIIERVLQFVDGETLLMCIEVAPEFAAAVKYLSKSSNIWEKCYFSETIDKYPYMVISKLHPHSEGFNHPKNWGFIYETRFLSNFIRNKEVPCVTELKIGKQYSDIQDIQTHEDLILVLVKYNKNFSIFHRIITINFENNVVDKSFRFNADLMYITPIEDTSNMKTNSIMLFCNSCQLVAVPVCADKTIQGFPKFSQNDNFIRVEHSNGEVFWINSFDRLLTKGKCFHTGRDSSHAEINSKAKKSLKVYQGFTSLYISCGDTYREFNTFRGFRASATASFCYSNLLFLGTDTGMIYVYNLSDESDLQSLNLECYIKNYNVCSSSILVIDVTELEDKFVIVCCSEKSVYTIYTKRRFQNYVLQESVN